MVRLVEKVYRTTDYDWVCAESPEQAQSFMLTLDYPIDEVMPLDKVRELTKKEMLEHTFVENDGHRKSFLDKYVEHKSNHTQTPFHFACTDW